MEFHLFQMDSHEEKSHSEAPSNITQENALGESIASSKYEAENKDPGTEIVSKENNQSDFDKDGISKKYESSHEKNVSSGCPEHQNDNIDIDMPANDSFCTVGDKPNTKQNQEGNCSSNDKITESEDNNKSESNIDQFASLSATNKNVVIPSQPPTVEAEDSEERLKEQHRGPEKVYNIDEETRMGLEQPADSDLSTPSDSKFSNPLPPKQLFVSEDTKDSCVSDADTKLSQMSAEDIRLRETIGIDEATKDSVASDSNQDGSTPAKKEYKPQSATRTSYRKEAVALDLPENAK